LVLAPYRIRPTLEPTLLDETDAYEAGLQRAASRLRLIVLATCGAIAAAAVLTLVEAHSRLLARHRASADTEAEIANLREVLGAAKSFAVHEQAAFSAAMSNAMSRPMPVDRPASTCHLRDERALPIAVVAAGDTDVTSPSLSHVLADATRAEGELSTGRVQSALRRATELSVRVSSLLNWPRYEAVVVATDVRHPVVTTPTTYEPGAISGRVYVYDFERHRVACSGEIHAASSERIEYPVAPNERPHLSATFLEADLDRQIRREIVMAGLALLETPYKAPRREP
jgi:hypothetical protein